MCVLSKTFNVVMRNGLARHGLSVAWFHMSSCRYPEGNSDYSVSCQGREQTYKKALQNWAAL